MERCKRDRKYYRPLLHLFYPFCVIIPFGMKNIIFETLAFIPVVCNSFKKLSN